MSYRAIDAVIQALLTEEDLRVRFAIDPLDTLNDLTCRGVELTRDERDLFVRTDARVWFWKREVFNGRAH